MNNNAGERGPIPTDRRSFGSMTFLFATPSDYGPFKGRALGNLRANLVYRLYTGSAFLLSAEGIQGYGYGPMHTRTDLNVEKRFGKPSGLNATLAVEIYNLFNQKDNRDKQPENRTIDFDPDRYQQYGMMGLTPLSAEAKSLDTPEFFDVNNYWDSPRELAFSLRVRW